MSPGFGPPPGGPPRHGGGPGRPVERRSHPVFDRSRQGSRQRFRTFLRERGILVRRPPPPRPDDEAADALRGEDTPIRNVSGVAGRHYFLRLLGEFRYDVLRMALLSLFAVGFEGAARWTPKFMIDYVFPEGTWSDFGIILLGLAGAGAGGLILSTFQQVVGQRLSGNLSTHLKRRLMRQLLRLPLPRLQDMKVGGLISRLHGDTAQTANLMNEGVLTPLRAALMLVFSIGTFLRTDARVAGLAFICMGVMALVALFFIRVMRPIRRMLREEEAILSGHAAETFGGLPVVRAYHRERAETRAYTTAVDLLWRKNYHASLLSVGAHQVMGLTHALLTLLFWGYGGHLVMQGQLKAGDLVVFISFTDWFFHPIMMLMGSINNLQNSLACAERVYEVLDEPVAMAEPADAPRVPSPIGDVVFDGVSFRYPGSPDDAPPALSDIHLTLRHGEVTALVGTSGAGKTTVTNLAIRFYDPTSGRILVGGRPLTDYHATEWRKRCGLVLQDVFLFDGTIAENIAYGQLDASPETIERAAKAAHAHEFISRMPRGYKTLVGERGVRLSGGQKQRLALARALVTDPELLILDEATSALDSESEALIQDALGRLFKDRTTLVIAHRLSTVLDADRIVVMEGGRIVESGSHEELLAAEGRYHELYTRQMEKAKRVVFTWNDGADESDGDAR